MWKPPQRIDFAPASGNWPTAVEAEASQLFKPVQVGPMQLAQRTWVPAMVPWRASDEGAVTAEVIEWYVRIARGQPGAIVIEATGIRDISSGPLLRISDDRYIPGLAALTKAVNEASAGKTRLLIQLIDFLPIRRRPRKSDYFMRFLEISAHHRAAFPSLGDDMAIRAALAASDDLVLRKVLNDREFENYSRGFRQRVTDLHMPEIADLPVRLPGLFAAAGIRARAAGFDGIELHYAHAYTMASFLSRHNQRDDGYGQTREGRVRLPLEVYHAVRAELGNTMAMGCRMLTEECIEGGSDQEDARYFAEKLAHAGMDFLSFSRGGKFEDALQPAPGQAIYPYTGPSGYECMPHHLSDEAGPFGRNRSSVSAIRSHLRAQGLMTPVILTGGVHSFQQAESYLVGGDSDIIGMARQILADPDWFLKVRLGKGNQVRQCRYSNYCEGLDQKHKVVTCQLWDRDDLDQPGVAKTADGKRRLTAPDWSQNAD